MIAMKDSGIPWIGKIPEHWGIDKIKKVTIMQRGTSITQQDIIEGEIPVVAGGQKPAYYCNKSNRTGETITVSGSGAYAGYVAYWNEPIFVSDAFSIKGTNECTTKYLYYILMNMQERIYQTKKETGVPHVYIRDIEKYEISIPPLLEQQAIAEYLDKQCGDIDALIALEERKLTELQAYKQAVINEAVTKGLNLDAPMKDSGIPWIGKIPEHWEVKRIKNICSCNDEALSETTDPDIIIKYIEIGDVDSVYGIKQYTEYPFKDAPSRARRITHKNDIIISTVRTYLRAITTIKEENLIVSTGFAVMRPKSNVNNHFVAYYFYSDSFVSSVISNSIGISYPAISTPCLMSLQIPIPPFPEQQAIAEYLDERCGEIDAMVEIIQQKKEELKEYKKSVIYEYVTGKKEIQHI